MEKVDAKMKNIVFFDGVCHLCNGFVDAVISRDKSHAYLFAPLQGTTASELLPDEERVNLDTVIYYESGKLYHRSAAIIKIVSGLGGVYNLINISWIIPSFLRDLLYSYVAKNRYIWFSKRDFCRLPTEKERAYLLP